MLERQAEKEGISLSEYIEELERQAKEEDMTVSKYISYLDYLSSDAKAMREEEKELNEIYGYKASPDELPIYRC